jgi:hypothetical protein
MLNVGDLWQKALNNPENLDDDAIKALLDDRLWFVTDNLGGVSLNSEKETLFDLLMLVVDSLSEKRTAIINAYQSMQLTPALICQGQSQILQAINSWHEKLNLQWNKGSQLQNVLFFGILTYSINIWLDDDSPDAAQVMAKIDELITWLLDMKAQPMQIFTKFGL